MAKSEIMGVFLVLLAVILSVLLIINSMGHREEAEETLELLKENLELLKERFKSVVGCDYDIYKLNNDSCPD